MRDDEIGALIQRSLDRHVDDVQPAPDLGEWVVERGRVVRRRRRTAAVAGGVATLAVVAGAAVLVPRLGTQPGTVVPAGRPSTVHRTTGAPVRTTAPAPVASPTSVPTHHHRSTATVTVTPTQTVTTTDSPTTTPTDTATSAAPTDSGTTTPTAPSTDASSVPTAPSGPSISTPYGSVPYPQGTSTTVSSATVGSHYVVLVEGTAGRYLMSVASDGTSVDLIQPGNGTVNSFIGSPNGRFVASSVDYAGGDYLQVQRVGEAGSASTLSLPAGYSGHINGWTSDGVVVDARGSSKQLRWSYDRNTIETRDSSSQPWSPPAPAN